jgi:GT2 family glycosyltransferase
LGVNIWVVVLNWNRWRHTLDCLACLEKVTHPPHTIVVVDNGSDDDSVERIREGFPDLRLIETGANLGYAGGNNVVLREALAEGADFIWVLNNDTCPEPEALGELLSSAEAEPRLAALASSVMLPSGDAATAAYADEPRKVGVQCDGCSRSHHPAAVIQGPSLLFRTAALEEVGLFDEAYFHFSEELDLMERFRRAGWSLGLACRAQVEHAWGVTLPMGTPQAQYYELRNHLRFRRKLFGEHPVRVLLHEPNWIRAALSLRGTLILDFRTHLAGLHAVVDALRGRTGQRELGPGYLEEVATWRGGRAWRLALRERLSR